MEEASTLYDVATIGNYTKDTIVSATGTRHADGGGFSYAAWAAAGLGRRVAAITRLAREDWHVVSALERGGIDVFATASPHSSLMRLEYPTANVDERILTMASTAGSFTPDQVRSVEAAAYLISPSIRGEVPLEVIKELRDSHAIVAADIQGFIRTRRPDGRLEHSPWPEHRDVLPLFDILKTDAVEAESLTGEHDIRAAARALAELGPREIVLTHRGGVLVLADGETHEASFHVRQMVGRSGRGDTCLGSYLAMRLSVLPEEAVVWAAAVTSLKMETDGPFRGVRAEVVDLVTNIYGKAQQQTQETTTTTGGLDAPEKKRRV
jgi:sugar/nucleoside kinase (ribokinase family)